MARQYSNLFPGIVEFENLHYALRKAAKGKRGNPEVSEFEFNLETNLLQLQRELITKTYRPGNYHSFHIRDPKHRLISAAPFRDRVVGHNMGSIT